MEQMSSVGDERTQEKVLAAADNLVLRVIGRLDEAVTKACDGDLEAAKEVARQFVELDKALTSAFTERRKLDEHRRKNGGLGDGEIDFDAARSAILDSLDRIRAARGAGCVPE